MRVVFIGTGEIGVPTLRALLGSDQHIVAGAVTQPDRPVGRDQRIQPSPIKQALSGRNIPVLQPPRMKNQESIEQIKALAPDAIVVMAYGQILPPAVLELPRLGCLNLHASHPARDSRGRRSNRRFDHAHGRGSRHRRHVVAVQDQNPA